MVVGTLMNLCDHPNQVSIGNEWREGDWIRRIPIIVTGNDFSKVCSFPLGTLKASVTCRIIIINLNPILPRFADEGEKEAEK